MPELGIKIPKSDKSDLGWEEGWGEGLQHGTRPLSRIAFRDPTSPPRGEVKRGKSDDTRTINKGANKVAGRLKGKVAFVTAAGQGIGRAIAQAFINEGAKVIATDLDAAKLKDLKKAKTYSLDVRSTEAVNALAAKVIKEFGTPNILANCAGFVHQGSILECSEDDWDFSFDLNVKSMHRTLRAFVPAMLKNGGGSVINIASVAGSLRGLPNRYVYGTTKAAVIGLTKAMAADFVRQGLRVNAICPGTIQSPSLNDRIATNAKKLAKSTKDVRQDFIDRQPIGRLGTPEEIAAGAVWLASDESSYYTGQTMQIDGGMTT